MSERFTNLVELYEQSIEKYGNNPLFGVDEGGGYEWMTYREFGDQVDALRGGLAKLGIGKGDTVAIIANNRVEWAVAAYASYGRGATFCPMYESQLLDDWRYIVGDSGAKLLLTANRTIHEKVSAFTQEIDTLEHVYCVEDPGEDDSMARLMEWGREEPVANVHPDSPDELAGFIYTSGTTGHPKGVLLSHANMCFNIHSIIDAGVIRPEDRSLAFLPWAHVFGQNCELHAMFSLGASMGLIEDVSTLIESLAQVRPTSLFAVPRVFNKIYDGLNKKMAEAPPLQQKIFRAAITNSMRLREEEERGEVRLSTRLKDRVFDKLVFSAIRERFGGRLRISTSAGAALSPDVARFIDAVKIGVYEGYGLSETSPVIAVNLPGARKIGSVGKPLRGVEVRIEDVEGYPSGTGEICARGPNVMQGYHNLPEKTAEAIDDEGFFHTGDLGRVDEDGFVWILGRVKEQYKLENGKYVVPAPIEEKLALSGFILQAMIEGTNKPYNVAAIVIDQDAVTKWAKDNGVPTAGILESDALRDLISSEIAQTTKDGKSYERPKKFILLDEEWTPGGGTLTSKLSLKRRVIMERFGDRLMALYDQ
jgi:long-chain acyl-CoA synthetase